MDDLDDALAQGPKPRPKKQPTGRVGRPPLPEGERKNKYPVWLNAREHAAIVAGAAEVKESFGAYVRISALRRAKLHLEPKP